MAKDNPWEVVSEEPAAAASDPWVVADEQPLEQSGLSKAWDVVKAVLPDSITGRAEDKPKTVAETLTLPDPQLDPELNRQAMVKSGSPDSVMFNAGRGKAQADAMVERGAALEAKEKSRKAKVKADAEAEDYGVGTFAKDIGSKLMSGGAGVAESVVGLYDLTSGGAAGRVLEAMGYDPKSTKEFWKGFESSTIKQQDADVEAEDGFTGKLKALAVNPASLIGAIAESMPGTIVSGAVGGRFVKFIAEKAAAEALATGLTGDAAQAFVTNKVKDQTLKIATVAGLSEGAQSAGSIAETGRQYGKDWDEYILPALIDGLGTAAISIASGKIAAKAGIGDIETGIAARSAGVRGVGTGQFGAVKNTFLETLKEGGLEEMPQSVLDQGAQNIVTDKPLTQGMGGAAAMGLVTGGAMGGGHAALGHAATAVTNAIQDNSPEAEIARAIQGTVDSTAHSGTEREATAALSPNTDVSPAAFLARSQAIAADRQKLEAERAKAQAQIATASTPDEAVAAFTAATNTDVAIAPEIASALASATAAKPVPLATADSLLARTEADLQTQEALNGAATAVLPADSGSLGSTQVDTGAGVGDGVGAGQQPGVSQGVAGATVLDQAGVLPGGTDAAPVDTYESSGVFQTPQAADVYIKANKLEGKAEVRDTGAGFAIAPIAQQETIGELKRQSEAISKLNTAVANTGETATVERFVPDNAVDTPEIREANTYFRLAADVARRATGITLIPSRGVNGLGVAQGGNVFVDIPNVAAGGSKNSIASVMLFTVGHEVMHPMENSADPQEQAIHKQLSDIVAQFTKPGVLPKRQAVEDAVSIQYGGKAKGKQYAQNEIVADVAGGAMWVRPDFWARVYELDNGSTMRKVAYKFMQVATKMIKVAKGSRLDVSAFVTNVNAVQEAAAQAFAKRANLGKPMSQTQAKAALFTEAPANLRTLADVPDTGDGLGIYAEVAPDPRNLPAKQAWDSLQHEDKVKVTKDVMDGVANHVFNQMGLKGWSVEYTSGMFKGGVNPSAYIKAPQGTDAKTLGEVSRVFGHILDQQGMVAFDESNTTSDSQAGFVKVVLPKGTPQSRIDEIRTAISKAVPQAEGDTLRDGALVFGNFSEYGPEALKVSDEQFRDLIKGAVAQIPGDEEIGINRVKRFHSEYTQPSWSEEYDPKARDGYLEGTRYESNRQGMGAGGNDLRGRGRDHSAGSLHAIAQATDRKIAKYVDYYRANPTPRPDAGVRAAEDGAGIEYGTATHGAVSAVGHHFSAAKRNPISSSFFGSGLKGLERERLNDPVNADIKPRLNFYVDKGKGIHPEAGVGSIKHTVKLNNLYDLNADHLGIAKNVRGASSAERASKIERAVKNAGFDGYVTDNGGNQKFAVLVGKHDIAYSRRFKSVEDFDSMPTEKEYGLGNFNLDFTKDGAMDGVSTSDATMEEFIAAKTEGIAKEQARAAKQAELDDQAFRDRMVAKAKAKKLRDTPPAMPALDDLKKLGLHPEAAYDAQIGEATVAGGEIKFDGPAMQLGGFGTSYGRPAVKITKHGNLWYAYGNGAFVHDSKLMDQESVIKFAKHLLVMRKIQDSGFDIASTYRKGTILKLVETWKKLAGAKNAFQVSETGTSTDFAELAKQMNAMPKYTVSVHGNDLDMRINFRRKSDGQIFSASTSATGSGFKACTMGLSGSGDLGSKFYAVAGRYADLKGLQFFADSTLSSINTARRTEQSLSYGLKSGNTGVVLPGIQNRVYGYNMKPKNAEDHMMNIGRLLLAGLRNAVEVDPNIRRLKYNPATDVFTDSKGNDASAKVSAFLALPEARAYGMGRSTLARAVVTSNIISGTFDFNDLKEFKEPIAYSRKMDDDALSEEWGEPGAVVPNLKKYLGNSVMVHEDGTPIVMYHGTAQDVHQFKAKQAGAIFVTYNPNFAEGFAASSEGWMNDHYKEVLTPEQITKAQTDAAKAIMADGSIKLSERKAMAASIKDGKPEGAAKDALMEEVSKVMPSYQNIMPLVVRAEHPFDFKNQKHVDELMAQLDANESWNVSEEKIKSGAWDAIEDPEVQQAIRDLGHDSFFVMENGQRNLAVYDPNQIKSAIGNNGNYDINDDRIAYARKLKDGSEYDYDKAVAEKHERIRRFDKDRDSILAQLDKDAASGREAASVLRLMAVAGFRIGGDPDLSTKAQEAGTTKPKPLYQAFGASTLKPEHVKIDGSKITFDFIGKAGVRQFHTIDDAAIAKDLAKRMGRDTLFSVADRTVRSYYDSILAGKDYKTHDFRTWLATDVARKTLEAIPAPTTPEQFWHAYDLAIEAAARKIGDTNKVAEESYVDKQIFAGIRESSGVQEGVSRRAGKANANDPAGVSAADAGISESNSEVVAYSRNLKEWATSYINRENDVEPTMPVAKSPSTVLKMAGMPAEKSIVATSGLLRHLEKGGKKVNPILIGNLPSLLSGPRAVIITYESPDSADVSFTPQDGYVKRWAVVAAHRDFNASPYLIAMQDTGAVTSIKTMFGKNNSLAYVLRAIKEGGWVWMPKREVDRIKAITGREPISREPQLPVTAKPKSPELETSDGYTSDQRSVGIVFSDDASVKFIQGGDWKTTGIEINVTDADVTQAQNVAFSRKFTHETVGDNFTLPSESKFSAVRRALQDSFLPVLEMQQALVKQGGTLGEAQDVYRAEERSHGRIEEAIKDFENKVFVPMVEKAAKLGLNMDELSLFAYAKHAPERNAHIASIDKKLQDGGSGMTNQEAADIIAAFKAEGKFDALEDVHADLMAITATTRRTNLEEGLISQAQYDALESQYENYIPLRGFAEKTEDDQPAPRREGRGYNVLGKETMQALGRTSKAGDLLENVVADYEKAVVRGERNTVAKVFLDLVLTNPDPGLWEIDAEKTRKSFDKSTGEVAWSTVIDTGEDTLAVKVDGKEIYIKVHDPRLVRAMRLASKDETGAVGAFLNDTIGLYSTLMRNTLTRFNPAFAAVNAVRDFGMAQVGVTDALGFKGNALFTKHYAGATRASWRNERGTQKQDEWGRWFEEYRAAGGTTGGYYARGVEEIKGDIRDIMLINGASPKGLIEKFKANGGYAFAKNVGHVLEVLGSTSENAARVAAYRTAREMGKSAAESASIAKNLTTNFNRKGEWGQVMNTMFVFFNASVQGSAKVLQTLSNPKVQGLMAGAAAAGFMMAMANAANGGDDDDGQAYWDKIPDFEKERNFIIMLHPGVDMEGAEKIGAHGRYIKIPMPYGFNIFPMLGQNVADAYRHSKDSTRGITGGKAAINMTSAVFGSFNPWGGSVDLSSGSSMLMAALPSIADVGVQLATGVNAFGNPVAPFKSEMDTRLDSENVNPRQAGGWAHKTARLLNKASGGNEVEAGAIDIAPGTIENFWRNATGGTGTFLSDVFVNLPMKALSPESDITPKDVPVLRSFYGAVDGTNDASLFYERRKAINDAAATQKRYDHADMERKPDPDFDALVALSRSAARYTKVLSKIRKSELEIALDEKLSRGEKAIKAKEVKRERDELTKEFNQEFMDVMREKRDGEFGKN